ncbi:unnamed protein product [Dibothriocephalus latus]|uniref:Uncharacterized protein n=1 Tax=Dibothriocephalus latus TaxID=60516 RepID=A0A3P6RC92_DIBLA|nr:unnamed protein product [Dibothriocephalus latus]
MDTLSGHLKLTSEPEKPPPPQNARQRKMTPVPVPVLPPFFDPFAETEDTTTTLIRVLYTVTRPPLDDPVRVTERRLDVKFSCLDLLGNQQTLCELITFFRRIVPTESTPRSRSASRSTDEVPGDHSIPTPSPAHATAAESAASSRPHTLDVLVSVERLSLVLVRVPQHRWPRRPEYLATATLLGANFDWHHGAFRCYLSLSGILLCLYTCCNTWRWVWRIDDGY